MTQPLDSSKPWESGLTMILGVDPASRSDFLNSPWITLTSASVEADQPAAISGYNQWQVYRALAGGTTWAQTTLPNGNSGPPMQTTAPNQWFVIKGNVDWYIGDSGKTAHDLYSSGFVTSSFNATDLQAKGTVLNADTMNQAAASFYNTSSWLTDAIKTLQDCFWLEPNADDIRILRAFRKAGIRKAVAEVHSPEDEEDKVPDSQSPNITRR